MPHINRIRVNNVKYNFGTQSYEDFCLKPFGHNMLYDLANGGGKSVLMLLMLQTVLPNCTLDEKQPVEKLFRTGDGSQTIHSLVEWKLDAADVVNGFRYMTTGFCARKAQNAEEDERETAAIDYFNYCIFYRDYNANDICNLPLIKNKEKITYTGLRRYLKELERDNSLIVRLFDKKGEYQSFIADYGLYESEWEIIRGINKTEGHVRTYFETNYRTTRKVIEDLLIEEIIQKSFALRGGQDSGEAMSKTLLEMKDKLVELSKKRNEIGNYDRQMELISMFAERTSELKAVYARTELLQAEISRLYYAAARMEKSSAKEQEDCEKQLAALGDELWALQERIDAAHYLGDRSKTKRLEGRKIRLEAAVNADSAALKRAEHSLVLRESANDYLEYQEEKAKRDATAAEIAAMSTEKSALLDEVRFLTSHMKKELNRKKKELGQELSVLETRCRSLKIRLQGVNERRNALTQEIAAGQARAEQLRERLSGLDAAMNTKKRQVGLLVLEESANKKAEYEAERARLLQEREKDREELSQLLKELETVGQALFSCGLKQEQLEREEASGVEFLAGYEEQREQADRLLAVYGARDYEKLIELIRERDVAARAKAGELSGETKRLRERLERLSGEAWGGFLEELPEAEEWKEYIRVRHGKKVQTGGEYLAGLREDEREEALKEYPFLPYALVAEDGLLELRQDERLRAGGKSPVVPVVKAAALRNRRELFREEDIALFSKDFGEYFAEGAAQRELSRLTAQLEENERRMRRLADQRETYREDERMLWRFLSCFEEKYREHRKKEEERGKLLARCREEREELSARQGELARREGILRERIAQAGERAGQLGGEAELLGGLHREFAESQELSARLKETDERLAALLKEREELASNAKDMEREADETSEHSNALRMKLDRMEMLWKEKYQKYDVPGDYGECALSGDALAAELSGKCQAYEREHSEADDKNRLMQSYISAMNRCLRSINSRGISVSALKETQERGELYATSEQDIKKLRSENERAAEALAAKKRELEQITAEWNRLHGKTGQLAAELTKRYGSTLELKLTEDEIDEYIENNRAKIDGLKRREAALGQKRGELARETVLFTDIRKDIERMAHGEGIHFAAQETAPAAQEETAAESAQALRELFSQTEEEYAQAASERKKRREEFSGNLQKITETLTLLDAAPLAGEMRESVSVPENGEDTEQLVKNLYEVRDCLALEKSRIESGIEDIISLKENFENQCLQRCINIRTELDRLSGLSKITLDGEQVPMISLQIPYVKEELYRERMSAYIDALVEDVESFKEQGERLRYIRNALSFKKLFAVIVTDMNAIRLSLYKRERMKEQSRHLRYEEAVGSTGQSQGIYIQFLIAIINYIANINSGRGENTGLGKVIFIDNPFGAAKDIYIWEPIFELLKTNQVQLIVPARGTTPAITGRFDVNYVLGQKLVDGRQQTVVVDYHSSVQTDELEYIPLQFEQESFDFL